jgi:cytochrome P450
MAAKATRTATARPDSARGLPGAASGPDDPAALPEPFDAALVARPHAVLGPLRETCPVAHVLTPGGRPVWLVTREEDVRAGLLDPRLSLEDGTGDSRRRNLMQYDPPEHTRIRRLAGPALAAQRVEGYRPLIRAAAAATLADLADRRRIDLIADFARRFQHRVLCEVFAIREEDRADLFIWSLSLFQRGSNTPEQVRANAGAFSRLVRGEVDRRRAAPVADLPAAAEPGGDVFSAIVAAWNAAGDVTPDELVSLCEMLLLGGFNSTAQSIAMSVVALLTHPEAAERLRTAPALIPRAVDELLRWDSPGPFSTPRRAVEDLWIAGTRIPAGSTVILALAAANRDPRCRRDADDLDLDRPSVAQHLAFGLGPHYCPGSALARLTLGVALETLLLTYPDLSLAVAPTRLKWRGNHQHRGLAELPVDLGEPV